MKPKLPIAVVMATLVRGRMGGTEIYAENLIPEIANLIGAKNITQIIAKSEAPVKSPSEVNKLKLPLNGVSGISRAVNFIYLVLRKKISQKFDIAYYPFSAAIPRAHRRTKKVITLHDLQHRDLPGLFTKGQKIYRYLTYEIPAKRADAVITISNFSAKSISRNIRIPSEKIHVIYPGIDHHFFSFNQRDNWESSGRGFLYYPARGLKHKNHDLLFEAFLKVKEKFPHIKLILTGADRDKIDDLPPDVIHEGHVSRFRVHQLLQTADALVFPSLYEGFGFPPIEAMAVGCPVVCSNEGSLPEVCRDGAEYFDPRSVEDMANAIVYTLENPQKNLETGYKNSLRFDWRFAAEKHVKLFETLVPK